MEITGQCHCGAIRYRIDDAAPRHALCHCADCRRWSGAPLVGWLAVLESALTVSGCPAEYRSSAFASRHFCSACGTGLFYRNPVTLPGLVDVQSGTLDHVEAIPPQMQMMLAEKVAWLDQLGRVPGIARYPAADAGAGGDA